VSHLDLPKKWGCRPSTSVATFEDEALRAIADAGMAIEINTGGMTDPVREMYPSASLLARAKHAGIGLILSSDAHEASEIAGQFAAATQLARQAGYTELLRLSDRRPVEIPPAA
jgi:histidinol-phosphatase (PHP family)